ncbi:MAG TPA: trimeric intracellular cation channel family protein [Tepidisphaeraceae bacterium]|nr:trimeric intracellular cation channel family protein [Tepidisphaeraceae bacterium]
MRITPQTIIYAIDLLGTAGFAFSGAIRAVDKRPDFVGMLILAAVTGIGGSILRDVILNRDVLLLRDWAYPLVILGSAILTFFFPRQLCQRESIFKYFDAIGLGIFSAITTTVSWNTPGMNPLSVLFIATITGCAGGVIRDVIIKKETLVLSNELYVTPVIFGAASLMATQSLGVNPTVAFVIAMLVTTGLRVLSMQFDWRLPRILSVELPASASSPRPQDPLHASSKRIAPVPSPIAKYSSSTTEQTFINIEEAAKCDTKHARTISSR